VSGGPIRLLSSLARRRVSSPVFRVATTVGPIIGVVLIVLSLVLHVSSSLQAVLIAVGGLMLGLITLRIADLAPERGPRALQDRVERDSAYYLGYAVSTLYLLPWPIDSYIKLVDLSRIELHLQFSDDDQALLGSASREPDAGTVRAAADMLLSKARDQLPSSLWGFFALGGETTRLHEEVDHWSSTQQALAQIKALQENRFIRLDTRYASVVDELVKILARNGPNVTDEQRPELSRRIVETLRRFPTDTLDDRNVTVPLPVTDWYWVTEGATLFVGEYSVLARSKDSYEVSRADGTGSIAAVTHDSTGWHCSLHPGANEAAPCTEMDMVLHATHGGKPVTEARLILVRSG
jgi:hypothetical protein